MIISNISNVFHNNMTELNISKGLYSASTKNQTDKVSFGSITIKNIPTSLKNLQNFADVLLKTNDKADKIIENFDFRQYGHAGIPMKYPRTKYIEDIKKVIEPLEENKQQQLLEKFKLKMEEDLEGLGIIPQNISGENEKALAKIVENFTLKNSCTLKDKQAQMFFNKIIKGCPEFSTTIGKVQHKTHAYDISSHTFINLQNMMKNPEYQKLSPRDKAVAKMSMLLHDLGKRGHIIDHGHYVLSAEYAKEIMPKYEIFFTPKETERIINLIANHHWFEKYNTQKISKNYVIGIFKTPTDLEIAKIMARADLEGVSPDFHYVRMQYPNQQEYEKGIEKIMNEIK